MKVLVKVKSGAQGVTDLSEDLINGKRRVTVIFDPTGKAKQGDRLLCDPLTLRVIGYVD